MSEGGFFPWKVQKHVKKPTADYSNLQNPLPTPPEGFMWKRDDQREWRLAKKENDHQQPPALVAEAVVVDKMPSSVSFPPEEEWELLSDRLSSSHHSDAIVVAKAGSVRSIATLECSARSPHKIQRTGSSSTIDSADNALGPSGKGVLGVDYVEHVIIPSDTLQGLCLAYKISTTRLRQANHFSGNSLLLAPKKLVIPISKTALRSGFIRAQDTDAKEYKLHAFLAEFSDLTMREAKAYLELADWKLKEAIRSAREDKEWEQEMDGASLKSGEIRITMDSAQKSATVIGAGLQQKPTTDIPAIATKTVRPEDVIKAVSQHDNFGLELKPLHSRRSTSSKDSSAPPTP